MCKLGNVGHAPTGEIRCSEIDSESTFGQKQSCMYSTYMVHSPVLAAVYGPYGRLVTYYKKLEGLIMFRQNTQYTFSYIRFFYTSTLEISVHVYYVCRLPCQ